MSEIDAVEVRRWRDHHDAAPDPARVRAALEALGCTVTRYVYPPGTCFPPHRHDRAKCDAVLSGCLRIGVGNRHYDLAAGDMVLLPAGVEHSAEVIGESAVVSLDGVVA